MGTSAHQIGQYALHEPFATGGMATLHLARRSGPGGFGRTVVVKRLHPQYAHDADFVAMLLDEARLVARVHHPNVVAVTDVLHDGGELLLVLEYVHGLSIAELVTAEARPSAAVASAVVSAVLEGLHAAHEATHENGAPLRIVHRDVSPQNVMVGTDGVARVLDFGVAKATLRIQATRHGERKGKVGYMAPEQLARGDVDRRADVYAAGVVLWELLAGRRLFPTDDEGQTPPRDHVPPTGTDDDALGAVVRRALAPHPDARFSTAREMADALRAASPPAAASQVAAWVEDAGGEALRERSARLAALERASVQALADETTAPTGPADRPSRAPVPATVGSVSRRRQRTAGGPTLALVVALLTAGSFWLGIRARAPASATTSPTPTPTGSVDAAPATSADERAPVAEVAPAVVPRPAASAPRSGAARARTGKAAANAAAPSCSPPWTVDPNGIRTFRPECL